MAISDKMTTDYLSKVQNVSQSFKPLDAGVLSTALGEGGPLSGSLGFGNGGIDVLGLTPEQVTGLVAQRGAIQQQNQNAVNGLAALAEALTGSKETRAAMVAANRDIFGAQQADELQAGKIAAEKEMLGTKLSHDTAENKLSRDQTAALAKEKLAEESRFHDLVYGPNGIEYKKLTEDTRHHKALETLKSQEMIALKNSADIAATTGNTVGLITKLGEQKDAALKRMEKNDSATYGPAKLDYFKYHMMGLSLTDNVGTVVDSKDYKSEAGGYPQMMLGPDKNWYGITRDPNTQQIVGASATPIVYNPINMSRLSIGGTGTTLAKKHQP